MTKSLETTATQLESVLGTIRMYASEHGLTGEQIGAIFDAGCIVCADAGLYGLREPEITPSSSLSAGTARAR